jgi:F-type H+-transporting ATPase subunit beta
MPENVGHVIQISGPAVDVQFSEGKLPPIYQAVRVVSDGFTVPSPINVILEVQQHLGEARVRCIAMSAHRRNGARHEGHRPGRTDFRARGPRHAGTRDERDRRAGGQTRAGRIHKRMPIHRLAPAFDEQATTAEMFETGVKVIDLIQPFLKGGKIGLFGGAGVSARPWLSWS